MINLAVSCCTQ